MSLTLLQKCAASALIETIERQCRDGIHSFDEEQRLRVLVVRACNAFEMPTLGERSAANSNDDLDVQLVSVSREIAATPLRPE